MRRELNSSRRRGICIKIEPMEGFLMKLTLSSIFICISKNRQKLLIQKQCMIESWMVFFGKKKKKHYLKHDVFLNRSGWQEWQWGGLRCKWHPESEVAQSYPTLYDPMDCSPPGSYIHGIFQARILEWVAISFSRGSSRPRDRTRVSHIVGRLFTI